MTVSEPQPELHPAPPAASRVIPHKADGKRRVIAALAWMIIRLLTLTLRFRLMIPTESLRTLESRPVIFCVWHNRFATSLSSYRRVISKRFPGRRIAGMASASRDGAIVEWIIKRFGGEVVRGSSSRRGGQALREFVSCARRGCDLALTPDGPRGPRYVVQEGVIALAQLTQLPIVPISTRVRWKWELNNWDRFQIPIPFSIWELDAGEPILVPRDTDNELRERIRQQLEARMRQLD
ncbi:MAG: DUF374 domain-containing protein [Verrucomicrobia bacterium]|nr:DUF374 domain-containing protein [Verrucomicrobiota bacterium]